MDAGFWIAVASAEHVRRGRAEGFMQVNHGKAPPLRRIRPGDVVIYYSPTERRGEPDGLQSFTAIGRVREGDPYPGVMGGGFTPWRRDVEWLEAAPAPIRPLLPALEFGQGNWGYRLRLGLIPIGAADAQAIAAAMGVEI